MPRILCNNNQACCPRDWWRNLPDLSLATPIDACMCQEYSFTFAVSHGTAPYTWTISSIPDGLAFDTATGTLSGTPTFADTYELTVGVSDIFGRTDSRDYSLLVNPGSADDCGIEMTDVSAVTAFDGSYVDLTWGAPAFPFVDDSFYSIRQDGVEIAEVMVGANTYRATSPPSGGSPTYSVFFHHGSECPQVVYAILQEDGLAILEEGGQAAFLEE